MAADTSTFFAPSSLDDDGASNHAGNSRSESSGRRHWLSPELVLHSTTTLGSSPLSPSVVDIEAELAFWQAHHRRTGAWHRDVLPFNEYVPAFTLGTSLFLQCHDCTLEAFDMQVMAVRYNRVRRASRVEWHEARQAMLAAYARLQSHWESTSAARLADADADATPALASLRGGFGAIGRGFARGRPGRDRWPLK